MRVSASGEERPVDPEALHCRGEGVWREQRSSRALRGSAAAQGVVVV